MYRMRLNPALSAATCDGLPRREFLQVGAAGILGLNLADVLALRAQAAPAKPTKAESLILLWCQGGPSHVDTFDPKPDAPSEFRGEYAPIETSVSGIRISEHLPLTAKQMDKFAIVRTLTSNIGAHLQASQYMQTGYKPLPVLEYPSFGSVVSRELAVRNNMPPYIGIPDTGRAGSAGFMGTAYNAFPLGDPATGKFRVANINLPKGLDEERLQARRGFIEMLDRGFTEKRADSSVKAVDTFYQRAYDLITSPSARKALDVTQESAAVRESYGQTTYGQGALMARRLVEAGARFVTVSGGGWDTHQQNFQRLKGQLLPGLDRAYAALLSDLADRGMLANTLVLLMGEFGRTPKINPRGGRDHYPRNRFVCFAGGGVRGGQVVGESDATASAPKDRPVSVEDVACTLYTALGIDYNRQLQTPTGRPIHLAQGGAPIQELFS